MEESAVIFFDVRRILTVCSAACRFHSAVVQNLFFAISEKNRKLVQKLGHMSKRTTREKLISYLFLTFILLVACFNIIGSLSMLMIDKKADVQTLRSLGADNSDICRIFMYEGRLISLLGAAVGIVLGLLLCWLQQTFGFISMGGQSGSFIVEAYPVSVHFVDILLILATVVAVGWVSVWYPVRHLSRRLLNR